MRAMRCCEPEEGTKSNAMGHPRECDRTWPRFFGRPEVSPQPVASGQAESLRSPIVGLAERCLPRGLVGAEPRVTSG